MGREIRMVPPNWEHPKNEKGVYLPKYNRNYHEEAKEWIAGFNSFKADKFYKYYWEYDTPPDEEYCIEYTKEQATWYQVYETVSEGTPITPPFKTQEELINYLVNNGTFWNAKGYSREVAEKFVLEDQWVMSGHV